MKRIYIIVCMLFSVVLIYAQQSVRHNIPKKALLYNSKGAGVYDVSQASYYRLVGKDNAGSKVFYDYYMTGQLKAEKHYITINKQNDKKTVLDGVCRTFFKSGRVESIMLYKKGVAHGRAISFYPSGKVGMKLNYSNGVLDGATFTYSENGKIDNTTIWRNGKMIESIRGGSDTYLDKNTKEDLFCNRYKEDEALIMEQAKITAAKQDEKAEKEINTSKVLPSKTVEKDKKFSFQYLYSLLSNVRYQTNDIQFYDNIAKGYALNIAQVVNSVGGNKEFIYHYNMDYDEVGGVDKVVGDCPRQIGFWGEATDNRLTVKRINIFTWSEEEMLGFAKEAIDAGYQVIGGSDYSAQGGNFVLVYKGVAKQEGQNQIMISFIHKSNLYAGLYHIQMDIR